jgi:predicted heme/steroid binding protein
MLTFSQGKACGSPSAFAGKLGLAYITSLKTPAPGFAVAVPKPGGGYARRNCLVCNGTVQDAVEAATKWHDTKHLALHGTPVPVRAFHETQANSTSGIVGVREKIKVVKKRLASGETRLYEVPVVIAELWLEPGRDGRQPHKSQSKVFSISKHGRSVALALATAWRVEQVTILKHAHRPSPINPEIVR